MENFKKPLYKILFIFFLILDFIFAAFASYKVFSEIGKRQANAKQTGISAEDSKEQIPKTDIGKTYNFLILGYGGEGHDGGNLSDVIMIANVDPKYKEVTFISVPRDLWVEIPVRSDIGQNFKINAAYAIGTDDRNYPLKEPHYKGEGGGGVMAKEVVSKVTGLIIDNYISVDFERFKNIIDTLGGVEVEVPIAFDDYLYPVKGLENETCGFSPEKIAQLHQKHSGFDLESQFKCRYEHLHFDKGKTKMNGETALKFVRSRHSAEHGGDFARSQRQIAVINAAKEKLLSLQSAKSIDEIYDEFSLLVRTDLSVGQLKPFLQILGNPKGFTMKFVSLSTDNVLVATKSLDGQFILIPKEGEGIWVGVHKYINDQINTLER